MKPKTWFLALSCIVMAVLAGCRKDELKVYNITYAASEAYSVTVPSSSEAGLTVEVGVSVKAEKMHLLSVTANGSDCEKVSGDGLDAVYNFVMPEKDVELKINLEEDLPNEYPIKVENGSDYTIDAPIVGVEGEEVNVTVTVSSPTKKVVYVTYNDLEAEYVSDEDVVYNYKFTMPEEEVVIKAATALDRHRIYPVSDEHGYVTMMNCCDNWDADPEDRIFEEVVNGPVKFKYGADLGWTPSIKAVSESGKNIQILELEDSDVGKGWYCVMPDEELTITVTSQEKTDYVGADLVGSYKGYRLLAGQNRIQQSSTPVFNMTLNGNTSFFVNTDDDNNFDFDGCFTYNAATGRFDFEQEFSKDEYEEYDYGVSGVYMDGGYAFAYVTDIKDDRTETKKLYFSAKSDFTFISAASNEFGTRYLVEIDEAGTKKWFYIHGYEFTASKAELVFSQGSSIAEASSAIVYCDGTAEFRYDLESPGADPVFTLKGSEAGTYTLDGGTSSDPALVLDGLGNASLGSLSGTYTIEGNIVTFTSGGQETVYTIDKSKMTYTEVKESAEWDGKMKFYAYTMDRAYYESSTPTMGTLEILMDQDYGGKEKKGYAKFAVEVMSPYYTMVNIIGSEPSYTYEPSTRTLTFSGILVGTEDGSRMQYINVRFIVSEDKASITCPDDVKLRSTSGGDVIYMDIKDLVIQAKD